MNTAKAAKVNEAISMSAVHAPHGQNPTIKKFTVYNYAMSPA